MQHCVSWLIGFRHRDSLVGSAGEMTRQVTSSDVWYNVPAMTTERPVPQPERPRDAVNTVTEKALSLIHADGSVLFHYEEGEEFLSEPVEAINPHELPAVFKRNHLYLIAGSITTAISYRDVGPPGYQAELLAKNLAPYREHQDFVWYGADLVVVGSAGLPYAIAAPSLMELEWPRG